MKTQLVVVVVASLLPVFAQAALLKPESAEGRRVIRRLAEEATRTFVNQTDVIQGKKAPLSPCEKTRSSLLAGINRLELHKAPELVEAKFALEKTACPSGSSNTAELRKANNGFFAATLFLRESDARVN